MSQRRPALLHASPEHGVFLHQQGPQQVPKKSAMATYDPSIDPRARATRASPSNSRHSIGEFGSNWEQQYGRNRRGSNGGRLCPGPGTSNHILKPNCAPGANAGVSSIVSNGEFVEAEPLGYNGKRMANPSLQEGNLSFESGAWGVGVPRRSQSSCRRRASVGQPLQQPFSGKPRPSAALVDSHGKWLGGDDTPMKRSDSVTPSQATRGRGGLGRSLEQRGNGEGLVVAVHNHSSIDECFKNPGPSSGDNGEHGLSVQPSRRGSVDPTKLGAKSEQILPNNSSDGRRDSFATDGVANGLSGFPVGGDVSPASRSKDCATVSTAHRARNNNLKSGGCENRTKASTFPAAAHAENLHTIIHYLKNHYALDTQESRRGLETMTPEDVLGLIQCFYVDVYRTVRDYRDTVGLGRAGFRDEDPVVACVVEPEDFPSMAKEALSPMVGGGESHESGGKLNLRPQQTSVVSNVDGEDIWRPVSSKSDLAADRQPQCQQHPPLSRQQLKAHSSSVNRRSPGVSPSHAGRRGTRSVGSRGRSLSRSGAASCVNMPMGGPSVAASPRQRGVSGRVMGCPLEKLIPVLRRGSSICKHVAGGRPHLRYFRVEVLPEKRGCETQSPHLIWGPSATSLTGASLKGSKNGLSLHNLFGVFPLCEGTYEQFSRFFKKDKCGAVLDHNGNAVSNEMCAVWRFDERDLALTFLTEGDRDLWMRAMSIILDRNKHQPVRPSVQL